MGHKGFVASFGEAGAKALILTARSESSLAEIATDVKTFNPKIGTLEIPIDVSNEAAFNAAFAKVGKEYGSADVLISNAATLSPPKMLADIDIKSR